ncbi:hypothetical protein BEN74_01665 [Acinetobacter sp. WCHAc010034]|uniref:hypothetical protein n=1 Tax=Acinetobacter sp. WCHAc010034 TaxID=1879049 RepID=UPI000E64EE43|nr:hypothetical protein [Acinetobacter sp. WCHAc010034]AYA01715.1 hypothetical protein BEN74_01665 [Acinetobacter sp. WCHAc010034]
MKFLLILVLGFTSIQVYAKKCADFSTQQQAQKWYEQRKKSGQTGWKSLDRDGESYGQIWCTSIRRFSCLIAPLLVRRLGI